MLKKIQPKKEGKGWLYYRAALIDLLTFSHNPLWDRLMLFQEAPAVIYAILRTPPPQPNHNVPTMSTPSLNIL